MLQYEILSGKIENMMIYHRVFRLLLWRFTGDLSHSLPIEVRERDFYVVVG